MNKITKLASVLGLLACAGSPVLAEDRSTALMAAIQRGDYSTLPPALRQAVETGRASARIAASMDRAPQSTITTAVQQSSEMLQREREAYVAALPPRDKARGAAVLLGDNTVAGNPGKLYYFVSRAMPQSLLRAYAREALYTGGTLVMKGLRKGDTVKEYVEEVLQDFNSADGQVLAGMEINPNLFDMFGITVVPTTAWSNLAGLNDIGAGCQQLPAGGAPQLNLEGPDDSVIPVEKPTCALAPATSYYKLAGAVTTDHALDRFEAAGAPNAAMQRYRDRLAERHRDLTSGTAAVQTTGHQLAPITHEMRLSELPRSVLRQWRQKLAKHQVVQRGPYGPVFHDEGDDDGEYRAELTRQIEHGLGV